MYISLSQEIQSLVKALLGNSFSTNVQGTGPWERSIQFVPRVRNGSKYFLRWSWSQEKKEKPFTKATLSFSFYSSFFSSSLSLSLFLSLSLSLFFFLYPLLFLFPFLSLFLSLSLFLFYLSFSLVYLSLSLLFIFLCLSCLSFSFSSSLWLLYLSHCYTFNKTWDAKGNANIMLNPLTTVLHAPPVQGHRQNIVLICLNSNSYVAN